MTSDVDQAARELIALAALVIADRVVWTRHARAARRRVVRRYKRLDEQGERIRRISLAACAPKDDRALQWTAAGAVELAADDPDGAEVMRALDLLRVAGRNRAIALVEEEESHAVVLWTFAVASAMSPGVRLTPRQRPREVDLTAVRRAEESCPETVRSYERSSRRRRAA